MKNKFYLLLKQLLDKNIEKIILIISIILSIGSFLYFYFNGQQNLGNYDALSRLNIARKIIDNLIPGIAQIGSVWLPFPQLLMLPFIWSDFLWHSGIAGAIVSMASFVLSAYYLYKILEILFKNRIVRFFGILIYITNVNMLLLQTMAMTESLFCLFLLGATYYLIKWVKDCTLLDLIKSAVFVIGASLTRYEGYALFIFSLIVVFLTSLLKSKKDRKYIEGVGLIFLTLSSFGIVIWAFYSAVIFKDPFYFINVYTHTKAVLSQDNLLRSSAATLASPITNNKNLDLRLAFLKTWWSMALMNGVLVTFLAVIGFILFAFFLFKHKLKIKTYLIPLFILLSPFFFVLLSVVKKSIPLNLPFWQISDIYNKGLNTAEEYNIRYGIQMLPFVAIFSSWVLNGKFLRKILIISVILIQIISTRLPFYLIYDLSIKWRNQGQIGHYEKPATQWLKSNYKDGLIMISAFKHDPAMFQLGLPYKKYVHEGTQKYWIDSLKNPSKYNTWVYMHTVEFSSGEGEKDPVTVYLHNSNILNEKFEIKFKDDYVVIYKIKTKPEIEIQ